MHSDFLSKFSMSSLLPTQFAAGFFVSGSAYGLRRAASAACVAAVALLSACGGGGGSAAPACAPFTDSFGASVSCVQMDALVAYDTSNNGGNDSGDAGADGTAGDGAAIANTRLRFTDINNHSVETSTDANGYYRINLRGLKAPIVATVLRDNQPWKSMLISEIVPGNRKFYTINLTGLTDVVAYQSAKKEGLSSADALTPAVIERQKQAIPQIIADLNLQLKSSISAAGLDPATFNPLTSPFVANKTGYDLILETNPIVRSPDGSTVLVNACLTSIPPSGTLPYLKVVCVDDGSCPAGQVLQLIGGNNSAVPPIPRKSSCVPR